MIKPLYALIATGAVLSIMLSLLTMPAFGSQVATPTVTAPPLDAEHTLFAGVLARVVKADGVDYAALRADHVDLDRYRVQLARSTVPTAHAEKLVFYINAYNALTLALVVDQLPADQARWERWSIKDAGSTFTNVWKKFTFEVAGQWLSLNAIEHEVLRPLGEPRIHFAINCASRSCPPLIAEPFRTATLDAQLTAVATAFAQSSYHVRLDGKDLQVNPILSWFGDDFRAGGGVAAFLAPRTRPEVRHYLEQGGTLDFFTYDWLLNRAAVP